MESEIEAINGNILNEANTIIDNINKNESDLRVVNNKRLELDGIQRDLDDLMFRLTTFIADSSEECGGSDCKEKLHINFVINFYSVCSN